MEFGFRLRMTNPYKKRCSLLKDDADEEENGDDNDSEDDETPGKWRGGSREPRRPGK